MNNLSKNIKHLRTLKKLTQESLAEELLVTRSRISSYEENRSSPTIDFLIDFSAYFRISYRRHYKKRFNKSKRRFFY